MGCLGFGVDPDIAKILGTLDIKYEQAIEIFDNSVKKAKVEQEKQLETRKKELAKLKENNQLTEENIKKLNKDELKVEIKFLENEVDRMHYIYTVGLELVEPIRKVTLDKLIEKSKTAPAMTLRTIQNQIDEVKKMPVIEFLDSTYGKVLKDALEKKGMSATILKGCKDQLFKERKQRRKVEREDFGINTNEFDDESMDALKLDLYSLIESEYKDINKNFRKYARGKMIEAYLGSQ
jgi:hypothetical protein